MLIRGLFNDPKFATGCDSVMRQEKEGAAAAGGGAAAGTAASAAVEVKEALFEGDDEDLDDLDDEEGS